MTEFMFRVDLEFWVSPTETIEVDIHGNSPNLNAQIVHILEAADLIASMDYFGSQPFPKGIPDNTWVVGNGNHSQNSDPDLSKNVKKYLVCVKSPQLPSTDESFETIRNYTVEFPMLTSIARVHISRSDHGDFGSKLHRYLFAFLWAMEFQIDKLHPVDASADLYEDERQSFHSGWGNLAYEMKTRAKDKNPMTASDAIERILSCKTENEVILLMNHPDIWDAQKYETLSLETPINWSCGAPGLLINLHEGTLDSDRVINWVRVYMGIVRFVDSFDEDTTYFRDFILSVPDGTNYSPEDLLTDIGLPELIEFYKPQLEEHAQYPEPREDWMEGWLKD